MSDRPKLVTRPDRTFRGLLSQKYPFSVDIGLGFGNCVQARVVCNFCKFEDEPRTDHALARLAILSPTRGWESRLRDAVEVRVSRDHSVSRDRFAARSNVKSPYVHQPRIFAEPSHRGGRNPGFWEARVSRAIKEEGGSKGCFS